MEKNLGVLVVGVEDLATAGIVAVEAAHLAQRHATQTIVLLHVLDPHPVVSGIAAMSGYALPMGETAEEADMVLAVAERALRAECAGVGVTPPTITREIAEGPVAEAIEHTIAAHGAQGVVLGARRPHAFGRLVHPDVKSHVVAHCAGTVHVAHLQADATDQHP